MVTIRPKNDDLRKNESALNQQQQPKQIESVNIHTKKNKQIVFGHHT